MAPRRNLKQLEPVETAAEAGYVSPPKKRKTQQDAATNKSDSVKETNAKAPRLPRAAKSNKTEQAEVIESEPVKKSRATGKTAQAKKPPASVNQNAEANVKAKKRKTAKKEPATENSDVNSADNAKKSPTKKTRGKVTKKAGIEGPERSTEELLKKVEEDDITENVEETEEPPVKKARGKKENVGDSNAEKVNKTKGKVNEKKNIDKQTNAAAKKATKTRGKAAANVEPPSDEKADEAAPEETVKTAKPTKAATKTQARKKKDTSTDNVKNEKKTAKTTKGSQEKATKPTANEKSPPKKGRGKKQAAPVEKEEPEADLSTKEIAADQKGLFHSTMITENNKHGDTESESENVDTSKDGSSSPNTKEDEKPSLENIAGVNTEENAEDTEEPPTKRRRNKKENTEDSNTERLDKSKESVKKAGSNVSSSGKTQATKKKDVSANDLNNEKKTVKATKGRQNKTTKAVTSEKTPPKKGRGKKPVATLTKEEVEAELNAEEEEEVREEGLNNSPTIMENNKQGGTV